MPEPVSDEAVEAAARAMHEYDMRDPWDDSGPAAPTHRVRPSLPRMPTPRRVRSGDRDMTSPAVGTGIVAFIEARLREIEAVARSAGRAAGLPRWVLAEVAKDRAILVLHQPDYVEDLFPSLAECTECDDPYPCQTVRLLAAIDADHPDYDPSWKPVAG